MVARSYCIIHLADAAAISIKMPFSTRGALATSPAELVLAEGTGHVIAALVLLNFSFAAGAEGHIILVAIDPALKL